MVLHVFGMNNRWGNFPAISAGWLVSDEAFMKKLSWVSLLKLRGSYGVIGNNNIGNYTNITQSILQKGEYLGVRL
mgnify:CR=1 FL=1